MATNFLLEPKMSDLLMLFENPTEPVYFNKSGKRSFAIPKNLLSDNAQAFTDNEMDKIQTNSARIHVSDIESAKLPNLSKVSQLDRHENFSVFKRNHVAMANELIDIFMGAKSTDELLSLAIYARPRVNPLLFNYALSVVLTQKSETKNLKFPPLFLVFPGKFFNSLAMYDAYMMGRTIEKNAPQKVVKQLQTGTDLDLEYRLWYFREDIGVNSHHWHWHIVYRFDVREEDRDRKNFARRGELFYYMHEQMLARYNFERLCNSLARVIPISNFHQPISEGYFPKLTLDNSKRSWPGRPANSLFHDVNRDDSQITIKELERWSDRISDSIARGQVLLPNGERRNLNENPKDVDGKSTLETDTGINIIGNLVEASTLGVNGEFYGSLHNNGHDMISLVHDPDQKYLEMSAVMGDTSTAMRDPIFYRWHKYIDNIFQDYKETLPPYTDQQLIFKDVEVTKMEIKSEGSPDTVNLFTTYMEKSKVDLSIGLDFASTKDIQVEFDHLNHWKYTLNITVNNETGSDQTGTIRVFLAPKFNERGDNFIFNEHRLMMVELDKFKVNLTKGNNDIKRMSSESSVIIPYNQIFNSINPPVNDDPENPYSFCGCGWPEYMLIPRGTGDFYPCILFVMVTNHSLDFDAESGENSTGQKCKDAASYCGLRDTHYPDKRAMGFPFDRTAAPNAKKSEIYLNEFLKPNMKVQDVQIIHSPRIPINIANAVTP